MNPSREEILGIARHTLTFVSGLIVANGQLSQTEAEQTVGSLMFLVGLVWSILEKRRRQNPPTPPAAPPAGPGAAVAAGFIAATLLSLGSLGCATFKPGGLLSPMRVEAISRLAAYVGATADLRAHPEHRVPMEIAQDRLAALVASRRWDADAAARILSETAIPEFQGSEGAVRIVGGLTLIDALGLGKWDAREATHVAALITGVEGGLRLALAPRGMAHRDVDPMERHLISTAQITRGAPNLTP